MSHLLRVLAGLSIGGLGGLVFWILGLPLPWMLGALAFTMLPAVAGVDLRGPNSIRPAVIVVIGVLLGSRFTPGMIEGLSLWFGSLALLGLFVVAVALVVVPFYRFAGRMDWVTAYFAGMPGGLNEMIEIGEASGARPLPIILAHSLRIALTIAGIAFWFRVVQGHAVGSSTANLLAVPEPREALLLVLAGVVGAFLGPKLRLPAPGLLGPMLASAALHLTGLSRAAPPDLLVIFAQLVLGTLLGCRFRGIPLKALREATVLSLGATVLSLLIALGFAWAIRVMTGIGLEQGLLALAPGGLTEMSLIALAIEGDVAFVALHHVVRIAIVVAGAPFAFALIRRRRAGA